MTFQLSWEGLHEEKYKPKERKSGEDMGMYPTCVGTLMLNVSIPFGV